MKNKDLRIVFMGTPEFAVSILKRLINEDYNVVGVITAPDKPAGRGRKLHESAVKHYAKSQKLNILQPTNLKSDFFLAELSALKANLQIVVAFRMLPKQVWQMPKHGTFNLHASLLPNYRGAAPINWAIINGETETGVSTFFIDEHIDTGAIIKQKAVPIAIDDTAGSLHDRLMHEGSALVVQTIKLIETGDISTKTQQNQKELKTAYKLNKNNCKIDWNTSALSIYNKIRGLCPYPASWCYLHNEDNEIPIKIYRCKISHEQHEIPSGTLITDKKSIKVAVNDGFVFIEELKLPGKRLMDAQTLLNGFQFKKEAKLS